MLMTLRRVPLDSSSRRILPESPSAIQTDFSESKAIP